MRVFPPVPTRAVLLQDGTLLDELDRLAVEGSQLSSRQVLEIFRQVRHLLCATAPLLAIGEASTGPSGMMQTVQTREGEGEDWMAMLAPQPPVVWHI